MREAALAVDAAVRLRVPHAGLASLHPSDLAMIIDQLTPKGQKLLAALKD